MNSPLSQGGGGGFGSSLYAYISNDPLNGLDPFGCCDNPRGYGGSGAVMSDASRPDVLIIVPRHKQLSSGAARSIAKLADWI